VRDYDGDSISEQDWNEAEKQEAENVFFDNCMDLYDYGEDGFSDGFTKY